MVIIACWVSRIRTIAVDADFLAYLSPVLDDGVGGIDDRAVHVEELWGRALGDRS